MKQSELNELITFINEYLVLNEDNLLEKSRQAPSVFQNVLNIYYETIKEYKTSKVMLATKIAQRYRYYKEEHQRELSKIEIENYYVPSEAEVSDMRKAVAILESQIKYLEETIANMKSLSFSIKNFIELKKFTSGDY